MGHCDEILIADANLPAVSMAQRLVRLDGIGSSAALEAVLRLIPLDSFMDSPALGIEVVGKPHEIREGQQKIIDHAEGRHVALVRMERHVFYERRRMLTLLLRLENRDRMAMF